MYRFNGRAQNARSYETFPIYSTANGGEVDFNIALFEETCADLFELHLDNVLDFVVKEGM